MTETKVVPEYTEGVCGDGAAILKDGRMMTISEILEELNAAAAAELRSRQRAEAEIREMLKNPAAVLINWKRGEIDASSIVREAKLEQKEADARHKLRFAYLEGYELECPAALYAIGDARIVWVNEGDLLHLEMAGIAIRQ